MISVDILSRYLCYYLIESIYTTTEIYYLGLISTGYGPLVSKISEDEIRNKKDLTH